MTDAPTEPSSAPRPVIGLTGGIGAGKSTVAAILRRLGCVVADSDEMARAALRAPEIRRALVSWWGESILDDRGEIDRAAVAGIVFADPAQRRRLEGLVHPWIESRRRALFARARATAPALVIDAPLLLEADLARACDAVIFVDCAAAARHDRLRRTRGWDDAEISRREDSQLPLDEKRRRADYVVKNDGDLTSLEAQVRTILGTIIESEGRNPGNGRRS